MLEELRAELSAAVPKSGDAGQLGAFLSSDALDAKLAKFVVLSEATPEGLAKFAGQGKVEAALVETLLADADLMKRMLVADGASAPKEGKGFGPAQYGRAMQIHAGIRKASAKAADGVLGRLALAVALEHAVPVAQANPIAADGAPEFVDPVRRYLHFEKAYLAGELDPAFDRLSTWDLRMVVNGDEPDATLAWGREMLRNFRPDHIYNPNYGWRYVNIVTSDVKYGSQDVKYDRPELQNYQNMLMNGGVCGRRAFFGRFILRAFGIPTTARPSRGHAALAHWTPDGWVVNLGGGWGAGWTHTRYKADKDFLATTQARADADAFLKVKRAQWVGDALGEKRAFGEAEENPAPWNALALRTQRAIIEASKAKTLGALGEDLGEANESTAAQKVIASPVTEQDKAISAAADGTITIPAAAYSSPKGNTRDVQAMKSFGGGLQVFLPRFFPEGTTILRGGTWKGDATACSSGSRMLSGGYGRYENWGLRAAMPHPGGAKTPGEITLDLGDGVKMEMVYIAPGKFVMGGERTTDGRFECVEVPRHEVEITKGFYLGKYEVTQAQYEAVMGSNPSRSTKAPDCPVDNVGVDEALSFCGKVAELVGYELRLPTEAEWEYASRAGRDTKWFFGDDPSAVGDYAWFKGNAGGKSHPVGQKKPNPWGLYDIYGNVNERISDTYSRGYYANSPKSDPTGPSQGTKSRLDYQVEVPRAGDYQLTAEVVTANYDQRINVAANGGEMAVIGLPFTEGSWGASAPVTLALKQGVNVLRFERDNPPQYGVAVRAFTLKPLR
ncbi:MAG: SUMF1/EgtB/PvdO family nonheme iron enzyme [Verrucomicrobiales bacterium]